jgi:AcrR family transcriptional regulator
MVQRKSKSVSADRPMRSDAVRNRARILEAADEIFAEQGLAGGVTEIAERAGVGMGTLYRHFPTKEALIAEFVHQFLEEMDDIAGAAQTSANGMGLERYLYGAGDFLHTHKRYFLLSKTFGTAEHQAMVLKTRKRVKALLADAQKHQRINPDIGLTDIDVVLWAMQGLMETTSDLTSTAWRRQLAIMLAGMRTSSEPITEAPVTEKQAIAVLAAKQTP